MIDWPKLLSAHDIPFVTGGKSTSKNNAYVHCPFCGNSDTGTHMGISLLGKGWGCWRNSAHRGKSASKLLSALLNISNSQANLILEQEARVILIEDKSLSGKLKTMMNSQPIQILNKALPLKFTPDIKPIGKQRGPHRMFWEYLRNRGYNNSDITRIINIYDLHCSLEGDFRYRIIFPIWDRDKNLCTWTGRTIQLGTEPRYKTLTADPDIELHAKAPITNYLYNEYWLYEFPEQVNLIICEGPFDAMRLDYFCGPHEVAATCLFGKTISDVQLEKLEVLAPKFNQKVLLLDPDAEMDNFSLMDKLTPLGFHSAKIPELYKDPAEMPKEAINKFLQEILQ